MLHSLILSVVLQVEDRNIFYISIFEIEIQSLESHEDADVLPAVQQVQLIF